VSQNAKIALIECVKIPKMALNDCYFFQSYTTVNNTDLAKIFVPCTYYIVLTSWVLLLAKLLLNKEHTVLWSLSLRCHRVTVCQDINIQQKTSERTYSCSHSNFVHNCPGSFYVTLSHWILSQVILSHLQSLKLIMLEVHQFNIQYTVTQWWLPAYCITLTSSSIDFHKSISIMLFVNTAFNVVCQSLVVKANENKSPILCK
jgi:hypothetical protein